MGVYSFKRQGNYEKDNGSTPIPKMLLNTDAAIVICGDEAKEVFKGYWVQDCSAATENILIAAEDM